MNKETGWIKLYRSLTDNAFYFSEPFTRTMAWVDLLLMANHKPTIIYIRGNKVEIGVGQTALSAQTLAKRWRWSRGKVFRFLNELETMQQIELQKNNVTTLISIVNYVKYQDNDTADETAKSTADETADDTADGPQTDTNKNDKNDKNDKEYINTLPQTRTREEKEKLGFVAFGEFQNVFLKPAQRRTLDERFGTEKTQQCIDDLSCRLEEGNDDQLNNSKSHYATLLHWLQYQQQRPVAGYQRRELEVDLNALK